MSPAPVGEWGTRAGSQGAVRRRPLLWLVSVIVVAGMTGALVVSPVAVLPFLALWGWFSLKQPLSAFAALFFVVATIYARLTVGGGEAGGNGGGFAIADLLWLGFIAGFAGAWFQRARHYPGVLSLPLAAWAMVPFVLLAAVLPVAGVVLGGWSLAYISPAVRQVQWLSFGVAAYQLSRWFGVELVLRRLIQVLALSAAMQVLYGLIQLGFWAGVLGRAWIALDLLYTFQNDGATWFYYPRLTGLLVNPNSYGLMGVYLLVLGVALAICRVGAGRGLLLATIGGGVFAIVLSGSRSALLGLAAAICVWIVVTPLRSGAGARLLRYATFVVPPLVVAGVVAIPFLPDVLLARLSRFRNVLTQGISADVNAAARVTTWRELWGVYTTEHPLGTGVSSSYATGLAADNYYVATLVEGTPVFTFAFVLFLMGCVVLGATAFVHGRGLRAVPGLVLAAWAAAVGGQSLTMTALLQPQVVAPLWVMIGLTLLTVREPRRVAERPATSGVPAPAGAA